MSEPTLASREYLRSFVKANETEPGDGKVVENLYVKHNQTGKVLPAKPVIVRSHGYMKLEIPGEPEAVWFYVDGETNHNYKPYRIVRIDEEKS